MFGGDTTMSNVGLESMFLGLLGIHGQHDEHDQCDPHASPVLVGHFQMSGTEGRTTALTGAQIKTMPLGKFGQLHVLQVPAVQWPTLCSGWFWVVSLVRVATFGDLL